MLKQGNSGEICPLCGEDNNCQSGSKTCWCNYVEIPDYIIDMVPKDKKGKACICQSCIEKYTRTNK